MWACSSTSHFLANINDILGSNNIFPGFLVFGLFSVCKKVCEMTWTKQFDDGLEQKTELEFFSIASFRLQGSPLPTIRPPSRLSTRMTRRWRKALLTHRKIVRDSSLSKITSRLFWQSTSKPKSPYLILPLVRKRKKKNPTDAYCSWKDFKRPI